MAAELMRQDRIQAVIVGADRIAANGDVANKIGTYGVSLLAKEHGNPLLRRRPPGPPRPRAPPRMVTSSPSTTSRTEVTHSNGKQMTLTV